MKKVEKIYYCSFALILSGIFIVSEARQKNAFNYELIDREVRAVWLTTVNGLDWPKSTDVDEQKKSLREIVRLLKINNFNTIYFQVRSRADAMYRSSYEPWSEQLTGVFGKDPGWDPLEFLLNIAHEEAIEVHAWFNTFLIKTKPQYSRSVTKHLTEKKPEWVCKYEGHWWLNPGIPDVREYLTKVALEIVRNYNVDGIHFDFIRYPGILFPDHDTYIKYGSGQSLGDWRRSNISEFVRVFYDSAVSIKPILKIGSTPIGVYYDSNSDRVQRAYTDLFQESRVWLRDEKHDYLVPQVYYEINPDKHKPNFIYLAKDWLHSSFGRHIILGVGIFKPEIAQRIEVYIDTSRVLGAEGNAFFRYEHLNLRMRTKPLYMYPALPPIMPWKDSVIPNPPQQLLAQIISDSVVKIQWQIPMPAVDGDQAKYYLLFKSIDTTREILQSSNIYRFISGTKTEFFDKVSVNDGSKILRYAVASIDKGNNISSACKIDIVLQMNEVSSYESASPRFKIINCSPNPASEYISVQFEISEISPIVLSIVEQKGNTVKQVPVEINHHGIYVFSLDVAMLQKGSYWVKISDETDEAVYPISID